MQKYGKKKSYGKKRAYTKRTYRQYPMYKKITDQIHRYVRWAQSAATFPDAAHGPNLILTSNANQLYSYSFNLRNVVNSVDFQSLYDMYRINKVTIYMERLATQNNLPLTAFNKYIRVVHDYNDNDLLTNENDYLEYSNCKSYPIVGSKPIKVVLYPKIANKVENVLGGTAFQAVNSNKIWLNTVNDQTPHFGIKVFIPSFVSQPEESPILQIRVKYDMSFKNSK